jgi:hypothetical protein
MNTRQNFYIELIAVQCCPKSWGLIIKILYTNYIENFALYRKNILHTKLFEFMPLKKCFTVTALL